MNVPKIRLEHTPVDGRTEVDNNHVGNGVGFTIGGHTDGNSRFWSKAGDDAAAGTGAAPFRTQVVCMAAVNGGAYTNAVCLDSGTYDEAFVVPSSGKAMSASTDQTPVSTRGVGARSTFTPLSKYVLAGTEYFTDGANGNDAWDGTTEVFVAGTTGPKKTIGAGLGLLGVNDGLQIAESIYIESNDILGNSQTYIYAKEGDIPELRPAAGGSYILRSPVAGTRVIATIEGLYFNGIARSADGFLDNQTGSGTSSLQVMDCTFHQCGRGIRSIGAALSAQDDVDIDRNLFCECNIGLDYAFQINRVQDFDMQHNRFIDCLVKDVQIQTAAGAQTKTISFLDNIGEDGYGFNFLGGGVPSCQWTIARNTGFSTINSASVILYNVNRSGTDVILAFQENIAVAAGALTEHIKETGINLTALNCFSDHSKDTVNTYTNSVDGTDAGFHRISGNKLLSPRPDAPTFSTGIDGLRDMGPAMAIFELGNSGNIRGFTFDGQGYWFGAIRHTITGSTVGSYNSNDIKNFYGNAIVIRSDDSFGCDLNEIHENASGYCLLGIAPENFQNNLVYNNVWFGAYKDNSGVTTVLENNVYFGNKYGRFHGDSCLVDTEKNSISQGNSLYGFFSSTVTYILTYSCIADIYNSVMDLTDVNNIFVSPLFKDITFQEEDFRLRTPHGGYPFKSPASGGGDDSNDMGAWAIIRSGAISYTAYDLNVNPVRMHEWWEKVRPVEFLSVNGKVRTAVQGTNRVFTLEWPQDRNSPDAQTELLEYLAGIDEDIRLWPKGSDGILTGTGAIDHVAKTITDATLTMRTNRYKGYWIKDLGNYFRILSNTDTVFTVDDPDGLMQTSSSRTYNLDLIVVRVRAQNRLQPKRVQHRWDSPRTAYVLELIEVA